ncbi:glycosyltransferase family 4 protein [Microbacterium sp. NPDC055903]
MHVAYLCTDPGIPVDGSKGASIHVQEIVRAFQRRGDTVTVYATRTDHPGSPALDGVRVVTMPVGRGDAAQRERSVADAATALAAQAASDGCDLVYERYALFSDAATRVGVPSIVEVNAPLIEEQRDYRTLVDETGAEATTRRLLAGASVVACVSEPVARWAGAHGAAAPLIAPNGVDTRRFLPATQWHGALRVVFVGSLKPWHGVEVALDALTGITGVELTVIGDGPERGRLEQHARERGLAVDWLGSRTHAEIPGILSGMHVGLAPYPPSAGDYFSPLKAYEYLAAGLAVVASDVGQLPDLLTQSRTGIIVPAGDADALRGAVTTLRDDRPVARRLGAAARVQAVTRHDWDRTLETILAALPTATATATATATERTVLV